MIALCIILAIIIILLIGKIYLLKKSINEISTELSNILKKDTNSLITISSGDKTIKALAIRLNKELRLLREQRIKYMDGDVELKNAITNISHDIRTPLTAISGYLELLEDENKSETTEQYLAIIKDRTEALKELTDQLFKYSIILAANKELKVEEVSINKILEESIAGFYAELSNKNINPEISITEKQIIKNLDKVSLSRIFSNLINNAIKYSDGNLEIILKEDGELIFKNRATGLSETQVGKLFNRFFSLNEASNSTGLGLTISKTLVERMNGVITAEKENDDLVIKIKFA